MISSRQTIRAVALCGMVAALAACSSNPLSAVTERFGNNDVEEQNVPSDDNRKAVLALEGALEPDPAYVGRTIELPPPYTNAAWTQPGGDADHTMHHLAANFATGSIRKQWTVDIGAGSRKRAPITAPPVIADGRIFVIDPEAKVTAYDAQSGNRVWRKELTPDVSEDKPFWRVFGSVKAAEIGFGGGVAYDNGRVFITSGFGFVAALDAETGELLWEHEANAPIRTSPTAANGKVYAVTNLNEFMALDQASGELDWDYQSFEEAARFLSSSSPAAAEDVIVAPFSSGEVTALSDTGRPLWTQMIARSSRMNALSNLNDIAGSPVIDRGVVFAISHAGQMSAIDLRSGQPLWEIGVSGLQTPWVSGDYIYIVSVEGELVCINRNDGAVVWVEQLPKYANEKKKKDRLAWSGPVLAGGELVLASSGGQLVFASPQNGEVLRTEKLTSGTSATPVIANETLYVLTTDGKLSAYR
ncbi:PQQ-binding-like beta-propeller repeat protein [Aquisalinus flavus]|uniref:Pyrrolo-quinoline quinone n=1 Tax=Aquisalinus flavus TaxID=1526572 RepID=A0A8J2V6B4_9PROT|nr:PQQ-binding-like beta-propeller repeat protein [Aquisalinus flavus]MBD0427639.1 PQQ-binding-like beta-propeller repeat protein [Aquisalinus flavus]UNE47426.1 PQQ-binding-like beta-propeller repeat protein [Aquisalinus flavus]GGD02605.1 pyrrolo-quinoline quinone [Aquisalinus flavus]